LGSSGHSLHPAVENAKKLIPSKTNFRNQSKVIFDALPAEEPWYGIEQEYTLLTNRDKFNTHPYGWPSSGYPGP